MGTTAQNNPALVEEQFLALLRELLVEIGKPQAASAVSLKASFERDLGLASLDLVELLVRCEARFEVELPDEIAEEAETPAGWVKAILNEGQDSEPRAGYRIPPPRHDSLPEPLSATTLIDVLTRHAEADPGRVYIHLLEKDGGRGITYGELLEEAHSVATGLQAMGLRRNDTVAIMLPTGADFFYALFGVMLAGGIPVPVYPPTRPDRLADYVHQQIRILRNAGIRMLISFTRVETIARLIRLNLPEALAVVTVADLKGIKARLGDARVVLADGALLQYTSGSTADPKGVLLSHANILADLRAIGSAVAVRPGDAVVSWLPVYSDLGLVGTVLFSLYWSLPVTIFSPLEFLQRPEKWLRAIHDSRGTLSAAPNFAFELCARRIPAWTIEGIDLSCWRVAVNAGEPVMADTVARFTDRFRNYGFRAESMLPCYGLAESTVALTMPALDRLPVCDRIDRQTFETERRATPASPQDADALCFYSVGRPIEGQQVRILDSQGRETAERVLGRLVFRGATTTEGYFRNPQATAASRTPDGWVDSGDLAYWADGEIYMVGRSRDPITKEGRSMSPWQVEAAVGQLPGIVAGSVLAFTVAGNGSGPERLVVVAETHATSQEDFSRIETEVVRVTDEALGLPPDHVLLVSPGALPKTSNGKLRRNETLALYNRGKLKSGGGRAPWLQVVGLWRENLGALASLGLSRLVGSAGRAVTTALAASVSWVASAWTQLSGNRGLLRPVGRWALRLHGEQFEMTGSDALTQAGPLVYVVNRNGVLDPVILASSLSGKVRFSGEEALRGLPAWAVRLMRPLLLERPATNGPAPAGGWSRASIREGLRQGQTVLVFPDGAPGVTAARSRYRLDAFAGAIEAGARLQPLALRGRVLPAPERRLARPKTMTEIRVAQPVEAATTDAFALRQRIRETIAELHA